MSDREYSKDTPPAPMPGPVFLRGWRCKCPNCGSGPMMDGYLQLRPACPVCGEELPAPPASRGALRIAVLASAALLVPLLWLVHGLLHPEAWFTLLGFSISYGLLVLFLLPRVMGVLVAREWFARQQGAGPDGAP